MAEFESIGAQLPSNPGSWNEFLARTGMQPGPEAFAALHEELKVFRADLAQERGIPLEELHSSPLTLRANESTVSVLGRTASAS